MLQTKNYHHVLVVHAFLVYYFSSPSATANALELNSMSRHYCSNFKARQNHPTTYEESPEFKGPLILRHGITTSDNRSRIQHYYLDQIANNNGVNESNNEDVTAQNSKKSQKKKKKETLLHIPKEPLKPLKGTECTDHILKTIVDHLAYSNAPVDVKEVAESIEFYLRTRKRLFGAAKKYHKWYHRQLLSKPTATSSSTDAMDSAKDGNEGTTNHSAKISSQSQIKVYDLCSGHGLTGMLFAACNPPSEDKIVKTILVDQTEPPSHRILSEFLGQVCPWIHDCVEFQSMTLEEFGSSMEDNDSENEDVAQMVIATHACGSLTDKVLELAVQFDSCGIAAMPCCYTGTDKGTPYGIKRALGVSWAADIRRCFYLNEHGYHSDFSNIPSEITPMNRIIVAEGRI